MTKKMTVVVAALTLGLAGPVEAQKPEAAGTGQPVQMMKGMMGLPDAMFVPMMIKHHQQGIEMARLEEARGASASVKTLAAKIRQSQEKELAELKAHAEHAPDPAGRGDHKMMEQQSQSTMAKLKTASGAAVDHAFLEEMSKHHEMAIRMTDSAKLESPQLKTLAQRMLTSQRQELSELKQLLSSRTPR